MRKSYCAENVYKQDRDRFWLSLFVPADVREALFAVYALRIELAHVHRIVSEEVIAHIRYAWWEESLSAIAAGQKPREHPVLQALPMEMALLCVLLAQSYRTHYPKLPPDSAHIMDEIAVAYLRTHCPEAEAGWMKAKHIMDAHRERFGVRWSSWLALKLLWVGK